MHLTSIGHRTHFNYFCSIMYLCVLFIATILTAILKFILNFKIPIKPPTFYGISVYTQFKASTHNSSALAQHLVMRYVISLNIAHSVSRRVTTFYLQDSFHLV